MEDKCVSGASKRKKKENQTEIKLIYFVLGPHSLLKAITDILMLIYELTALDKRRK